MPRLLKPNQPFHKKIDALMEHMEKKGVSIFFNGIHTVVIDMNTGLEYTLHDRESGEEITQFPYNIEYKLRFIE